MNNNTLYGLCKILFHQGQTNKPIIQLSSQVYINGEFSYPLFSSSEINYNYNRTL